MCEFKKKKKDSLQEARKEKKNQFQFYFLEILNPSIRISRVFIFQIRKNDEQQQL